jgi:hypothetical protein
MQVKPRGEGRIKVDKGILDGYVYYKKQIKDLPNEYLITRGKYGSILKDLHEEISNKLLKESASFRMPCGLPTIRIKKWKRKVRFKEDGSIDPKSLAINWKATRELWDKNPVAKKQKKFIYFINDHTDGYSAMFVMEKHSANVPNLSIYNFTACRDNNRRLADILLNPYNKIDYYG